VGPQVLAVRSPGGADAQHVGQGRKQIGVEHFAAKRAVEALDEGIPGWLRGLDPRQAGALLLASVAQAVRR